MVEKKAAFRQRRAADTARWRERLERGAAVYPVEVDGTTFDLMERFGGLKDSKVTRALAECPLLGRTGDAGDGGNDVNDPSRHTRAQNSALRSRPPTPVQAPLNLAWR